MRHGCARSPRAVDGPATRGLPRHATLLLLSTALLAACGATVDDTEGLVNLPLAASEVVAVALLKQQKPGVLRASLRSKGDVSVRGVAALWGGGGHRNAAGCTATGETDAVKRTMIEAIGKAIEDAEEKK